MKYLGFGWQQRLAGSCARLSLRHALLCLGIPTTEAQITAALGKSRLVIPFTGIDEKPILRAIKKLGCAPVAVWQSTPQATKGRADKLLDGGVPCIVCVNAEQGEAWAHWAVLAGRAKDRYIWIDSAHPDLIGTRSWSQTARWLCAAGESYPYYLIGVRPKKKPQLAHSLAPALAESRRLLADAERRDSWGLYLGVLRRYFDGKPTAGISAGDFFATHGPPIRDALCRGVRKPTATAIAWELESLGVVADAHRMRIPVRKVSTAVEGITQTLRAWSR